MRWILPVTLVLGLMVPGAVAEPMADSPQEESPSEAELESHSSVSPSSEESIIGPEVPSCKPNCE